MSFLIERYELDDLLDDALAELLITEAEAVRFRYVIQAQLNVRLMEEEIPQSAVDSWSATVEVNVCFKDVEGG